MESRHLRTGFAAGDHALRLLKSRGIDQNNVLLFGSGVEEVARHVAKDYGFDHKGQDPSA
jgi:hypothetical protein